MVDSIRRLKRRDGGKWTPSAEAWGRNCPDKYSQVCQKSPRNTQHSIGVHVSLASFFLLLLYIVFWTVEFMVLYCFVVVVVVAVQFWSSCGYFPYCMEVIKNWPGNKASAGALAHSILHDCALFCWTTGAWLARHLVIITRRMKPLSLSSIRTSTRSDVIIVHPYVLG